MICQKTSGLYGRCSYLDNSHAFHQEQYLYFLSTNKYRVLVYRGTLRPTTKSKTDFYTFFMILNMYIAPGQNQTAPRGQNDDVTRNFFSRQSSDASLRLWTTIVSKSFILPAFF